MLERTEWTENGYTYKKNQRFKSFKEFKGELFANDKITNIRNK